MSILIDVDMDCVGQIVESRTIVFSIIGLVRNSEHERVDSLVALELENQILLEAVKALDVT